MRHTKVLTVSLLILAAGVFAPPVMAAECKLIYGGGPICGKGVAVTPSIQPTQTEQNSAPAEVTTKGGIPLQTQTLNKTMKSTPATGPENFVFPLLGATGALGYFLRKKS